MEQMGDQEYLVFVGTYSSADEENIHILTLNSVHGEIHRVGVISGVDNPSYLTFDPVKNRLFAVSEARDGAVVAFAFNPHDKSLKEINRQSTRGDSPCYVSIDDTGSWLLAVNYMSGTVCVFPIEDSGRIGEMSDQIQLVGHSVQSHRQEGPHPHSIVNIPSSPFWIVQDLGADKVYVYRLDADNGKLRLEHEIQTPLGSGPRHVAFHPSLPLVYIIQELDSTIVTYQYDRTQGTLEFQDVVSALPDDEWSQHDRRLNTCADIHLSPNGSYLYGSNRGHDSIATYRVTENGYLETAGFAPSHGKNPRNFCVVPNGSFLLVANQDSDSIVVMDISQQGVPKPTGVGISVKKPVCLKVTLNPYNA